MKVWGCISVVMNEYWVETVRRGLVMVDGADHAHRLEWNDELGGTTKYQIRYCRKNVEKSWLVTYANGKIGIQWNHTLKRSFNTGIGFRATVYYACLLGFLAEFSRNLE